MNPETHNNQPDSNLNYWKSIFVAAALIPLIFWFRFGRIDGFVIGFTVFLLLLITAVHFIPALAGNQQSDATSKNVSPSKFDRLGVVWLLSIPFAPFISWMISEFFTITVNNWKTILAIKAALCVLLPCICVIPLIRYIKGKTALVAAVILVIGTCFPVIIGWNSMLDLIEGPQESSVVVSDVRNISYTRNFRETPTEINEVTLDNGKVFQANEKYVSVKPGVQTLVLLPHVEVVLETR